MTDGNGDILQDPRATPAPPALLLFISGLVVLAVGARRHRHRRLLAPGFETVGGVMPMKSFVAKVGLVAVLGAFIDLGVGNPVQAGELYFQL